MTPIIASKTTERFVSALRAVAGGAAGGLHEPVFAGNEKKYLADCIDTGFVSSVGEYVTRFEDEFARFTGARHAVAVTNGTTGLHLALVAVGVKPGNEVLVPAMSFIATANAVAHAGAVPHFVDVSEETWGLDPQELATYLRAIAFTRDGSLVNRETGRTISAVVPMHTLGHPLDMQGVIAVAEEFGLVVVEDSAESLGSRIGETHTGLIGTLGVFSFNGNKTITTGGGGAIVTNDEELANHVKHLSTTARVPHRFEFDHDEVGYNYRMPNINAALGVAQMEQLPEILENQRRLFDRYKDVFGDDDAFSIKGERAGTTSNFWLQALYVNSDSGLERNDLIEAALDAQLAVRPLWKPLNTLRAHAGSPSAPTPVAHNLYDRVVCLPSSSSLVGRS
jgi:aminotransferase in exopolysaccharide biosynthesis